MPPVTPDSALDLDKKRRGWLYLLVPHLEAYHSPYSQNEQLAETHVVSIYGNEPHLRPTGHRDDLQTIGYTYPIGHLLLLLLDCNEGGSFKMPRFNVSKRLLINTFGRRRPKRT